MIPGLSDLDDFYINTDYIVSMEKNDNIMSISMVNGYTYNIDEESFEKIIKLKSMTEKDIQQMLLEDCKTMMKEKQNEADVLKSKYEEALSETETEKKKVLQEARKSADEEYQRIVKSARKEAEKIKIDAEADANSQKAQILKNAEKEIADMVIDATAKVVASEKATSNSAIYDRFLNKAGDE